MTIEDSGPDHSAYPTGEQISREFLRGAAGSDIELIDCNFWDHKRRFEFAFRKDGVDALISKKLHPRNGGLGMWERAALAIAFELGQAAAMGKIGLVES